MTPGVAAALASAPHADAWRRAFAAASEHAPYLKRLASRRPELVDQVGPEWAEQLVREALAQAQAIAQAPPPFEHGMRILRQGKDAVHLAIAIADLARAWPLQRVTGAITDFADAALRAALAMAAQATGLEATKSRADEDGPVPDLAIIAMGKMGAGELNYSSDIDFSVFFDAEALARTHREPRAAAVRLVAPLVRALEEVTQDGYVFRTDLRLRPDPGSTPVAVSIASAEHYYQSLGQNWERAAFIKARAAAGDRRCGHAFLEALQPFVWRKHLDFAAVEDVHSIKRQILSAHGSAELEDPVFDLKLGRGGIRDIELFAQTQQLILGGRNKTLRGRTTLGALEALAQAGAIAEHARAALSEAYVFYREVEHRVQMLEDAQSHQIPRDAEARERVAKLCGFDDLRGFEAALVERRGLVSDIDRELFGRGESLADPLGSLIFTGVEDHPETVCTIGRLGFGEPALISQTVRGWHHGRVRAMRSQRARELLTRLTPRLLHALADAGDPDETFARFAVFFSRLSAGVQLLALLEARPALLGVLARLLAIAPRLADRLAQRPALLDALIEQRFFEPLSSDAPDALAEDLSARLEGERTFEDRLNAARRFQREEAFRIGVQMLEGLVSAQDAGSAYTALAEACVKAMTTAALAETERTLGPQPGAFAVLALGKFGGMELTDGADLDLMLVYDAPEGAGGRDFYARLTQRLISALSAPTEEGILYEIDAKLRPSGSKGPVAVRLPAFQRYYFEEAWTWELLALCRLRAVAGDAVLGARAEDIARSALGQARDRAKTLGDVAAMRARMARERPPRSGWDIKLAPGGFVDIEFMTQGLQLVTKGEEVRRQNTGQALGALAAAGVLAYEVADRTGETWRLLSALQQLLRLCVGRDLRPGEAPAPLLRRLAHILGVNDFGGAEAALAARLEAVRDDFVRFIGPLSDGSGALSR